MLPEVMDKLKNNLTKGVVVISQSRTKNWFDSRRYQELNATYRCGELANHVAIQVGERAADVLIWLARLVAIQKIRCSSCKCEEFIHKKLSEKKKISS